MDDDNKLNNTGRVLEAFYKQAWAILPTNPERAEELAKKLLLAPRLGAFVDDSGTEKVGIAEHSMAEYG